MSTRQPLTKENFNECMKDLGKLYRKMYGKEFHAEIILIGGGAVLAGYGFRELTYDVDAILKLAPGIKEIASNVADKYGLERNWLNDDFTKTTSYTEKLVEKSQHYRQFSNVLNIRVVSAEYLVAMKLMSGREYKYDMSDVIGIIKEHNERSNPLDKSEILKAFQELYGDSSAMPLVSQELLNEAFEYNDLGLLYRKYREVEEQNKSLLTDFETKYPKAINAENLTSILDGLKQKQQTRKA